MGVGLVVGGFGWLLWKRSCTQLQVWGCICREGFVRGDLLAAEWAWALFITTHTPLFYAVWGPEGYG